jgi:hypothetical protein
MAISTIANKEYCGTQIMEVNGQEIELESIDPSHKTNAKAVLTMNSKGRALGSVCGINEYSLKIEVPVPVDQSQELNWRLVKNATITLYPQCGSNGTRTIYTGVTVEEVSEKYGTNKAATRSLTCHALDMQEIR